MKYSGVVEPLTTGQAAKDYLTRTVNPTLLKGLTALCKKKPEDPIVSSNFWSYSYHLRLNISYSFIIRIYAT